MATRVHAEIFFDDRLARRKSASQRQRTVRLLASQIEWLDGTLRWRSGRLAWTHSRGELAPTAADFVAAQRALHHLARYPDACDRAFGDGAAWLQLRQEQLEQAKRLSALRIADPDALIEAAVKAEPLVIQSLAEMLPAEALCLDPLPFSPSQTLLKSAKAARAPVARCPDAGYTLRSVRFSLRG